MKIDLEREYLVDDMLAREIKWMEEERLYYEERNRRLPAVIKVMIPKFKKHEKV
jgi:hypothetical protein